MSYLRKAVITWSCLSGLTIFPVFADTSPTTTSSSTNASSTKTMPADIYSAREGVVANMLKRYDVPFILYPYDGNYVLATYTSNLNQQAIESYDWAKKVQKDELKFQLSLGFPIVREIFGPNTLLAAAYTQRSWWQFTNFAESAPFRETNYEPQVFLGWAPNYKLGNWTLRDGEFGLVHQSNGRADPTSRSWNRVYWRASAQNNDWLVDLKTWYRIPENPNSDDNPDITKYLGYYQLKVGYAYGENVFSISGRYNWSSGYGCAELGWSYPLTKHVRFYTQLFSGYGESMIDYNYKQTRLGIGILLNDMM